ncbi:MAG: aminodeoxychorismate lyase [Woeseiaceae bacterium]
MNNILINGKVSETISINDRGLQYGDGLFETMAVHQGKIPLWESHWQRLSLGCEKLFITCPSKELLENEITLLCESNNKSRYVMKLIVTRGEGQRGYRFTKNREATRILSLHPWPQYPDEYQTKGVDVRYCNTKLSENEKLSGVKHLNRLEQVLARNEWDDEFQEGLMLSSQEHVIDGTMSNVFAVLDNTLFTPELSKCGVSGVMRKTVINIAKALEFTVHEKSLTKVELERADELFLTNSVVGIWPIKQIANKRFTQVGDVTKQLQKEINKIC